MEESEPEKPESIPPVTVAAVAAVQEIAAAKKAAMSEIPASPITITEEKIQWLSGKQPSVPAEPEEIDSEPESLEDMTRDEAMNYLLDSIAEINSTSGEPSAIPEPESPDPDIPEPSPVAESALQKSGIPPQQEAAPKLTHEPDSQDIYIKASRRIRELCEEGRLTMEQVDSAVREQLVQASEVYSTLDVGSAQLPPAVKEHAMNLAAAADHLTDYFALGEDIAARVMFFMLYQMLSYTDRIVQSDETKQRLNTLLMVDKKLPDFPVPVKSVNYMDGCKVLFDNGWLIARFSGTEPRIRIFCEMPTREEAERLTGVMAAFLHLPTP